MSVFRLAWNGVPQWVFHQVAWWCCVLGPEPWGWISMAVFVAVHLGFNRSDIAPEVLLIAAATGGGLCVDGCLASSELVRYEGVQRLLGVPLWMLGLWAGFGATLRHSQRVLVASPTRALWVGAIGGPMAYGGGQGLGRLEIAGLPGFLLIGLTWALALGLLSWLMNRHQSPASRRESPDGGGTSS